ncbi:transferase [Mycolicibacterium canariasense]|uniref:D,D-heptose 1,7-bisphosphate phosphatase n=1 Tax=Mycolicibacterium canariasense TaxID=228230 RepID=A0A124E369_MYCCR|nr:HAD-IIIA family hydrolase [Mycolicibacterium canariasense]MCV7208221.1 HAD-IIIA family hydrolase [Mycolicibacterium canariasense]ORV09444.1 HAD family hydrolase [Mycolicibacterium canariasense]GAS99035.1 transferase [Mycolicibacterium canariasense]
MTAIPDVAIVIPTIGRESLYRLLAVLDRSAGPAPAAVIVVDDRRATAPPLPAGTQRLPVAVLRSGGRGPAAARNAGWRSAGASVRWICFLDDDVIPDDDWLARLGSDLEEAEQNGWAATQGRLTVPAEPGRRATDDERRTQRLAQARWITADMAYRRSALVAVGGFDERFPRAYREDSDLALRVTRLGGQIGRGQRHCTHPVARADWRSAVRAQIGNRDDALLRRKHGRHWRRAIGEGRGRLPGHIATTVAGVAALSALATGRRHAAGVAAAAWLALSTEFGVRRFAAGPRTAAEALRLAVSTVAIPPVAVAHRLRGWWDHRGALRDPPLAVLFDRDDTLIEDGPYLNDPGGVRPVPGAATALDLLRRRGLRLGVVTNQSGVAKGLITPHQLASVNARVDEVLGPFDSWQVCVHDADDNCACRKPSPGMVQAAADALGVRPSRCVLIGDTGGDVEAALAADADAVLVPTERTLSQEISAARSRARVAPTLRAAVDMVLRDCR